MLLPSLLSIALVLPSVQATIRFGCAQLVTERFDPLVTPGQVSPHVHQIIGGVSPVTFASQPTSH
ncbi:hypothetical protein FA15DRAFT_586653 [Coprinopsis marcescibilis]|uniref:Uncharacterized protein n=1 Tax=Coprinopsis marcescibilis TaxID=230819 RepID=A0A5C3L3P9_COPMA|nr:hypothetical protein FA15DRAFT_586653 [Coprinopsis marcescibilis]